MYEHVLSTNNVVTLLLLAFVTEAFIELLKESDISKWLIHGPITKWHRDKNSWYTYVVYKWITCGQCMSVIYSVIPAAMLTWYSHDLLSIHPSVIFVISLLAIQRLSNWFNSAYRLLYRGRATAIELLSPLVNVEQHFNIDILEREIVNSLTISRHFNTVGGDVQSIVDWMKNTELPPVPTQVNFGTSPIQILSSHRLMYIDLVQHLAYRCQIGLNENCDGKFSVDYGHKQAMSLLELITCGTFCDGQIEWRTADGVCYRYDPHNDVMTTFNDE